MKESIAKPLIRLSQKQFHVLERYKFSILWKELIIQTLLKYDLVKHTEPTKKWWHDCSLFALLKIINLSGLFDKDYQEILLILDLHIERLTCQCNIIIL